MRYNVMAKVKKNLFVHTSGIFGKYLLRCTVYLGENLIALLGFIAITAIFAATSYTFGLTTAAVTETTTAAISSYPILTQLLMFAIPLAASEIIKKIYKDNLDWLVMGYKGLIMKLFTPKSFEISEPELAVKREKHEHEPEKANKYATPESYAAAKKAEYEYKNLNRKYPELDVAGRAGKRAFKSATVSISNGLYWLSRGPSRMKSSIITLGNNNTSVSPSTTNKSNIKLD